MKESSNQKMQENKPVLELRNTEEKVCQNMWIKLFRFYPPCHCALMCMAPTSWDQNYTQRGNIRKYNHIMYIKITATGQITLLPLWNPLSSQWRHSKRHSWPSLWWSCRIDWDSFCFGEVEHRNQNEHFGWKEQKHAKYEKYAKT